ncbi:MAG TPA: sigma-70 family RNA polymerase sigma factor [Polyangiaceae bacterium]
MQEQTDQQLLEHARSGDARALEALLERHQSSIYRFGLGMCRNPEDAKDVLQDTLLAMARGVRDFRGASSLSTWLYTIARSFCIKKRRKSREGSTADREPDGDARDSAELVESLRTPEEIVATREVRQALQQAIASLEPAYREVLLLRDVEGLTAPEVAQVMGLSVQAVKSRLHRARLAIRSQLSPLLGVPLEEARGAGSCPDVLTLVSRHLEGEVSAEVCEEMEKHVSQCPHCRSACDSLRQTLALCRTAGAAEVPAPIQAHVKQALRNLLAGS